MSAPPRFSIDLSAELAKITACQHLNDVHYLVQLVRHAITFAPETVDLRLMPRRLVLTHDGAPMSASELDLLWVLLDAAADPQAKHEALAVLESAHGVALLSLFLGPLPVTLHSGTTVLAREGDGFVRRTDAAVQAGYVLTLDGVRKGRKNEQRELLFFCSGSRVPLRVNGSWVNQPILFENQVLKMAFENEDGRGEVGIPMSGDTATTLFYKMGIRVGSKSFLPEDGRVYHGWWDDHHGGFEDTYAESTARGDAWLVHHAGLLYAAVGEQFAGLDEVYRERLKKVLFHMDPEEWAPSLWDLPLFHTSAGRWRLSSRDLEQLARRFYGVPFAAPGTRDVPACFPLLEGDEPVFVRRRLGLDLKAVPASLPRTRSVGSEGTVPAASVPDTSGLLEALHTLDPETRYTLHAGRAVTVRLLARETWIGLPCEDPRVRSAQARPPRTRAEAVRFKYRMLSD